LAHPEEHPLRALDLIVKKRDGYALTEEEIRFLIQGYVSGDIPEYQISSWLMAIYFRGMSRTEAGHLTQEMIDSGRTLDLSGLKGPFVDKHSTGGVGDKVSLILAPLAAACGLTVPMMSGRALGHTGGTLDKLESIPGYTASLDEQRFRDVIGQVGYAMTGQSADVVPADRKLYALRDVTGTVESIPLITASILSKKFAEGADALVFDVKCGAGAFMKSLEEAQELANSLVETGRNLGKKVIAVLTNMEQPLGAMVGNFLEVEEACALLGGTDAEGAELPVDDRSDDLMEVTLRLTSWMLVAGGIVESREEGEKLCRERLKDGSAWEKFTQNVTAQGGSVDQLRAKLGTYRAPESTPIVADRDGFVAAIDAYKIGMAGVYLGAGRSTADDPVFPDVGIEMQKKIGSRVSEGDALCTLYAPDANRLSEARTYAESAFRLEAAEEHDDRSTGKGGSAGTIILDEITAL
jgi:pyrimidine-nucleoside phosphorylase